MALNEQKLNHINSAEMTSYWRSLEPILSGDGLSINLVSSLGVNNATNFMKKFNYNLVARLIGIRAGYFLRESIKLINTGKFDSCISFASGFSLLSYYINNLVKYNINFYDTDLPHVSYLRKNKIDNIKSILIPSINNIELYNFDLEDLSNSSTIIKETFPNIKNPLILLEGISYFISEKSLIGLFKNLEIYKNSAIIFDYFPDDAAKRSKLFAENYKYTNTFIPAIINSLNHNKYINKFKIVDHQTVQLVEAKYCKLFDIEVKLQNENNFFPTQFIILENSPIIKG